MNPHRSSKVQLLAMGWAILAVSFWGASFTATKVAVKEVSPLMLLWLRFAIGAMALGALLLCRGKLRLLPVRDLLDFALLGFVGVFLHNYIQSTGLQTVAAGVSAVIVASTPVVIAVFGAFFLAERLNWLQILGIVTAAAGVILIVTEGQISLFFEQGMDTGELFVMTSVLTWASFSVMSRNKLTKYSPSLAMFYVMLSGWFFISITMVFRGSFEEIAQLDTMGWISVLFLGLFCSALAYLLWYSALKALPASRVGIFMYLQPLVGVSVASFLLSEPLRITLVTGGALILTGMTLVNYRSLTVRKK